MRYTNPRTRTLSFKKAWFFFGDNVQHVLVNGISSTTPAPVYSVLDQRLHKGPIYLNGEQVSSGNHCGVGSLWHSRTGYVFPESQGTEIWLEAGNKTGDWQNIGISALGNVTNDMFAASIVHDPENLGAPMEYSIFPATNSYNEFEKKANQRTPKTVMNNGTVSAALDSEGRVLGAAFWSVGGGSVRVGKMGLTIYVDRPIVLMLKLKGKGNHSGEVYVADPTHGTGAARVRLVWTVKGKRGAQGSDSRRMLGRAHSGTHVRGEHSGSKEVVLNFTLPEDGLAGSTVMQRFEWCP
jgi:hypothetical protein